MEPSTRQLTAMPLSNEPTGQTIVRSSPRPSQRDTQGDMVVRRAIQMLRQIGKLQAGRVLIVEPGSPTLGHRLRELGYCGERWALMREPVSSTAPLEPPMESAYERCDVQSWPTSVAHADQTLAAEHGLFDLVLALDPLKRFPEEKAPALLDWLRTLLAPRGILILRDSSAALQQVAPLCIQAGLLPVADEWSVDDQMSVVAVLQSRGAEESRQTGILNRSTLAQISEREMLRYGIITAYREVFGGDEWREWERCIAPGCGRQYSRRDAETLASSDSCECGWPGSLESYHTAASVMAEVRHDLGKPSSSCCYLHTHPEQGVDAFVWGYVTRLGQLAQMLISEEHRAARQAFTERVQRIMPADLEVRSPRIYYQAQIGAREGVRSFGLLRGLFHRALQFAADQGCNVVVTRTSPRTSVYPLLLGIGMQVVYRYDAPLDVSDILPADEESVDAADAIDSSAPQPQVQRVVLAGDLERLLRLFYVESDRRVIVQIAHQLRRQPAAMQVAHQRRHQR